MLVQGVVVAVKLIPGWVNARSISLPGCKFLIHKVAVEKCGGALKTG